MAKPDLHMFIFGPWHGMLEFIESLGVGGLDLFTAGNGRKHMDDGHLPRFFFLADGWRLIINYFFQKQNSHFCLEVDF